MKRDMFKIRRGDCGCCPGHDTYPGEAYKNKRSKKARSRDKKVEHQHVRSLFKRQLKKDMLELE